MLGQQVVQHRHEAARPATVPIAAESAGFRFFNLSARRIRSQMGRILSPVSAIHPIHNPPLGSSVTTEPYHHDSHMSYYGGDGKLRVFNRHIGVSDRSQDSTYGERGTFDEYRYDALGRRVLTRTRRIGVGCPSTLDCQSRVIRTVWDGDRVLYEIKAPAGEIIDTLPTPPDSSEEIANSSRFLFRSEALERNTFSAIQADTITDPQIESDAEFVSYSYAPGVLGVDEPIEIHKGSETVIPHTGWRGMLAMGTYPDGTPSDCAVANPCTRIDWPAMNVTTDGAGYNRAEPSTWYGSIASTGTEGSGLQYMRNRYYDPKRGQFTQADPIGLAGGLNLYGFASGDPVNFGDPFGLCSPDWLCKLANVSAGFGDAVTFGLTDKLRDAVDANGVVDKAGGAYLAGELGGLAASTALGSVTASAIREEATLSTSGPTRRLVTTAVKSRGGAALFGKAGALNKGSILRIGVSKGKDGRMVFRMAGKAIEVAGGTKHIDLVELGRLADYLEHFPR